MARSTIAKIIAILMLLSLFACGAEEEAVVPEYEATGDVLDYGGEIFTFLVSDSDEHYLGYINDSYFSDFAKNRVEDVKKALNVDIVIVRDAAEKTTLVQNEAYAGYSSYSAVHEKSNYCVGGIRAGLYYDFTMLTDYIDYRDEKKWGSPEHLKPLFWNGGLYGVTPNAFPLLKYDSMQGLIIVNEEMIKGLGETDPRDYVENGEWTWTKLEELMPVYAHTDNTGKYVYALYSTIHWLYRTIQTTNGGGVVYKDSSNEWQLGLHSAATFEAFTTAHKWAFGELAPYVEIEPGNGWQNLLPKFVEGESVLCILNANNIYANSTSIAYTMKDFAILNFPSGPDGSYENPGTTITDVYNPLLIPALAKEPEMSAVVLNAIYEPFEGYEDDEAVADYLMQYYFYDRRDVDNFINGFDNIYYDYRNEGLTDVVINITGSKTITEWLEQYEDADELNRQKYVVNIESTIEELYGD